VYLVAHHHPQAIIEGIMEVTFTQQIDGYKVTVWMLTVGLWAYTATSDCALYRGTVDADNRVDAVKLAVEKILALVPCRV